MFIETSALVAIALDEPEGESFLRLIAGVVVRQTGSTNVLEASVVLVRRVGYANSL